MKLFGWPRSAKEDSRVAEQCKENEVEYTEENNTIQRWQNYIYLNTELVILLHSKGKKTDSICTFDQKTDTNVSNLFLDRFLSLLPIFTKCLLIEGHGVGYVSIMVASLAYNVKRIKVSAVIWCHIKKTELKLNVFQVCRVPLRNKYYKYSVI